jgi:PadR family transcriptional regulator PadR
MRMTGALERVLGTFLADAAALRYGYDLMKAARLQSGTLYPLLARLEREKLVASRGRPRTRTGSGPASTTG